MPLAEWQDTCVDAHDLFPRAILKLAYSIKEPHLYKDKKDLMSVEVDRLKLNFQRKSLQDFFVKLISQEKFSILA